MIQFSTNDVRGGESSPHHMISRGLAVAMAVAVIAMFGVLLMA